MSQRRAVFLDVDGTYALHGRVPDAHVGAVRAARAAGHKVFLCTGRPVSALPHSLTAAGFDGFVCAAGAYAEIDGETIADVNFEPESAAALFALLDEHEVLYIIENSRELLLRRGAAHLMTRALGAYGGENAELRIEIVDDLTDVPVAKVARRRERSPAPRSEAMLCPVTRASPRRRRDIITVRSVTHA